MGCFTTKVHSEKTIIKSSSLILFESKSTTKDKSEAISPEKYEKIDQKLTNNSEDLSRNYQIIDNSTESPFISAYNVNHIKSGETRSLRFIKKSILKINPTEFLKQIELFLDLEHPNLLKIHDIYYDEKNFYIITDLILYNTPLFEQISCIKGLTERTISFIMEQIFSSLFYLHSKGIIHRYITPDSIMIDPNTYLIKIVDYGIFYYYDINTKFTNRYAFPYFYSPETCFQSSPLLSCKNDIWNCGVILYFLLSGKSPFEGKNSLEIINNIKKGKFCFEKSYWDQISNEVKYLIERLLRYSVSKRINAEEAWKDLWIIRYNKRSNSSVKDGYVIPLINLKNVIFERKFQKFIIDFLVLKIKNNKEIAEFKKIFNNVKLISIIEIQKGLNSYFSNKFITDYEFDKIKLKFSETNNTIDTIISAFFSEDIFNKLNFSTNIHEKVYSSETIKEILDIVDPSSEDENFLLNKIKKEIDNYNDSISMEDIRLILLKISNI